MSQSIMPECLYRASIGFPLETCGNDGLTMPMRELPNTSHSTANAHLPLDNRQIHQISSERLYFQMHLNDMRALRRARRRHNGSV